MNVVKRLLVVFGTVMLAGIIGVLLTPKALHAVATAVQVVNTFANPVPTWRTDNDGRNPVRLDFTGFSNNTFFSGVMNDPTNGEAPYSVPVGKRLVVDTISVQAQVPPGQKVFVLFANGTSGQTFSGSRVWIPLLLQGSFFGGADDILVNSIPVHDYVDSGNQYSWQLQRNNSSGEISFELLVFGHLVDCTNGGGC